MAAGLLNKDDGFSDSLLSGSHVGRMSVQN